MSSITNLFSGPEGEGKEQNAIQGIHVLVSNMISRRWQSVLHLASASVPNLCCPKLLGHLSQRPSDSCSPPCPDLSCLKQFFFRYNFALKKVAVNLQSNEGCREHRRITDLARCLSTRVCCLSVSISRYAVHLRSCIVIQAFDRPPQYSVIGCIAMYGMYGGERMDGLRGDI